MDYLLNIVNMMGIYMLLSLSTHVILGRCGILSLGQAGFFAIGAYASALLSKHLGEAVAVYSFSVGAVLAIALGSGVAVIVGLMSRRLKGDYLTVITLCFSEVIRLAISNSDHLGGPRGIGNIPGLAHAGANLGCVALGLGVVVYAGRTALGRRWVIVQQDEVAAESLGFNSFAIKLSAFAVSGALAGLAGHLYCQSQGFVHPSIFSFEQSVLILLMVIIGGLGSLPGAVLGAAFFTLVPELLRFVGSGLAEYRMVIFAGLMILFMLFRPRGFLGTR